MGLNCVSVEFHFDFGSPNAYLSHVVLPAIEQRTGIIFKYVPVLLGGLFKLTNNRSPMESFAGIKNKMEYQQLETLRFLSRHGITQFRMNPHFPVNTLMLMRGAVAAQSLDVFSRYVDVMFHHMWVEPKKLDDVNVWREILQANGFVADQFAELVRSAAVKGQLAANVARSFEKGAFGSPTFFVNDEIYFGKDRLDDVEAAINRLRV